MIQRNGYAAALFVICSGIASAQIGVIKTYAGNDSGSYPGNGGPATSAIVTNPIGLAVDSSGNLYIAASGNSVIRQVNASTGVITTVAGGGTGGDGGLATAAQLTNPCDVKLDSAGNIYLSETCVTASQGGGGGGGGGGGLAGVSRIRRVDATTRIITTIAGTSSSGFAGDGGPATAALLNTPTGLAIDASGNIFVADAGNHRIRRIDAVTGFISTVAGNGTPAFAGDGGPATSASLNGASGVTVDANGNLFIADTDNNRIRRVDAVTGVIATVAGTAATAFNGDGIAATSANVSTPISVTVNSSGNVVFADFGNNRIRFVDNAGLIWTIAGDGVKASSGDNGQATLAGLNGPAGVAFQASGPMYVSELLGDHVRQIALPSAVAATAVTVSSTATSFAPGAPMTLTATLTATNGAPYNATGGIMFFDGTQPLSGQTVTNGAAQFTTSTLALGTHNISAVYYGDSNYGGSYGPVFAVTVAVPPTTVSLSASPNPAAANQQVTLTATVTPSSSTGSVTFNTPVMPLGSAAISGGVAILPVTLPAGNYTLTAQYSGVTSPAVSLTVKASATLALASSANPSNFNQAVTFTATVTPATATGTVQFSDGSTVIGSGTIASGVATFSTSTLAAGQHSISAVYNGDANDSSAGAGPITQSVLAATSVALASSQNPAYSNTPVVFTASVSPAAATGTVQFVDGGTVLGSATLSGGSAVFSTSALNQGTHSITAAYGGDASDASSTSVVFTQTMKSSAGMTVGVNPSPISVGQTVTFTANVNSSATGTVQFTDASTVLATVTVASGTASYATSTLAQGSHTIGVSYSGDSGYMSQSTSFAFTVLATTTTTLASSSNPATTGQSVTLTVTVAPAASTGTVQLYDGSTSLGAVTLNAGTATYSTSSLAQGSHTIVAQYGGDATHAASSTSFFQAVKSAAGMTTGVSPSPSSVGQTVTFTANVNSAATGTVQFSDGSTVLTTVSVASGAASYATSALAQGSHMIGVSYSGDSNYLSQSTSFTLNVLATTTTSLASSANPSTTGQNITLTATVAPAASTGTVQFYDGSTSLGAVTLSGGTAAYSTSSLAQGNHTIVAQYGGDATHAASSVSFSQSVKSSAGMTTGVSPSPAVAGQTVQLTANVNASATGTVTFTDGGTTLATVSVSSGRATFSTASLAAGSHSLGFGYSGDSNYLPATASFSETVLAASSVAVASSVNPSTVGQSVTFTAMVTPATATGTVQFLDGGSVIGTATLASGAAAFSTTTLAQGTHSITASYGGDAGDSSASSSALSQVVNASTPPNAPTSLTATSAGSTQINLAWTASSTSGVAYNVYGSTTSGFTPSSSNRLATGVSTTSYSATGLTGSTTYYFKVTATKGGLESAASNQASAATSGTTSCHVVYSVSSQWGNGFNGAFSIENTGTTTMTSWTLTWAWAGNQDVTQAWNANYKQSGANVTMTNMSYNNSISPGATLSGMGFGASYSGTNASPTTFYVNGVACH